jgi:hypothetical protein
MSAARKKKERRRDRLSYSYTKKEVVEELSSFSCV